MSELKDAVEKNYDSMPISVCHDRHSDKYILLCFELAWPLEPILQKFHYLNQKFPSLLFQNIWACRRSEISEALTIADIIPKLWDPIFKECKKLIDGIYNRDIKLKDVDYYFRSIKQRSFAPSIKNLHLAIESCDINWKVDKECDWINKAVVLIEHYFALCNQADAANIVLKLKEKLNLIGDFTVIENVAKNLTKSMEEETLSDIDQRLIEAKSFLERLRDNKKLDCLKKFGDCFNLINWIRDETNGKN